MLGKLLSASEFGQWSSFVSPAFFDVMPTRALWQRFKALAGAARDPELLERALAERRGWLARSRLPVRIPAGARAPGSGSLEVGAEVGVEAGVEAGVGVERATTDRAAAVAALYFHQLLHGELTLLDLRAASFTDRAGVLAWRPAAWITRWDPSFIVALRRLYTGFYAGETAEFHAGLRALNLLHAEPVFRQHFGDGQGDVRFEVKHFVSTFHRVFVLCKAQKTQLHPDFLPLGLYLASLYDHLERLAVPVDVATAFATASAIEPASRAADAAQAEA